MAVLRRASKQSTAIQSQAFGHKTIALFRKSFRGVQHVSAHREEMETVFQLREWPEHTVKKQQGLCVETQMELIWPKGGSPLLRVRHGGCRWGERHGFEAGFLEIL